MTVESRELQPPETTLTETSSETRHESRRDAAPPRLADVANLAGVSLATASRVLNNIRVKPELREAVEQAVSELGYVPNRAAQNLAARRTNSVGVVVSETTNHWLFDPFITHLLYGISEQLNKVEVQLALVMVPNLHGEERVQRYVQQSSLDGVILIGTHSGDALPEWLVGRGMPLVLSGRPPQDIPVGYVDADHRRGAQMAVSHLVEQGCRRIATIHGSLDMPSSLDKLDGYREALAAAGIAYDPSLTEAGNYSPTQAGVAMRALLDRHPDIDGLFAASDTMAAAAFGVIGEAGLRIPADIAVVGYDGTPVGMSTRPLLTTVRQPIEAMGREMARLLLECIEDPDTPPGHTIYPTELIVRGSSVATEKGARRPDAGLDLAQGNLYAP